MAKCIAVPTLRARIDPAEALAKAEANMRAASTNLLVHKAAKGMDDAAADMLGIVANTHADRVAQRRAADWINNRARLVSNAVQRIEDMNAYRNRRVMSDRPYAGKAT